MSLKIAPTFDASLIIDAQVNERCAKGHLQAADGRPALLYPVDRELLTEKERAAMVTILREASARTGERFALVLHGTVGVTGEIELEKLARALIAHSRWMADKLAQLLGENGAAEYVRTIRNEIERIQAPPPPPFESVPGPEVSAALANDPARVQSDDKGPPYLLKRIGAHLRRTYVPARKLTKGARKGKR